MSSTSSSSSTSASPSYQIALLTANYIADGAGNKRSLKDVIAARKAKESARRQDEARAAQVTPFIPFKPLSKADYHNLPSDMNPGLIISLMERPNDVLQFLTKIPGFNSIKPLVKVKGVELSGQEKATSTIITNPNLSFTIGSSDGTAKSVLVTTTALSTEEKDRIMKLINDHYLGNGTIAGLVTRIKKQIPFYEMQRTSGFKQDVSLPLTPPLSRKVWKFIQDRFTTNTPHAVLTADLNTLNPEINTDAQAGAPFFNSDSVEDHAEEIFTFAVSFLERLQANGAAKTWAWIMQPENLPFYTMILSAKTEIMERAEYFTKVRPYFVAPAHLRLLFTVLTDAYASKFPSFDPNSENISAFRFTWAKGGAEKLWAWVSRKRKPGIYFKTWGDDQLWIVVCKDGTVFALAPDVSGMDMKINDSHITYYYYWLIQHFCDVPLKLGDLDSPSSLKLIRNNIHLTNEWFYLAKFFKAYLSMPPVLMWKHFMFQKLVGLASGINATTHVDFIGSCVLCEAVSHEEVPTSANDIESVRAYVGRLTTVATLSGFPLKRESMLIQNLQNHTLHDVLDVTTQPTPIPSDVVLALPFLGHTIKKFKVDASLTKDGKGYTLLVPALNPDKIYLGSVYGIPRDLKGPEKESVLMAACIGRGLSCFTDKAFDYLRDLYARRVSTNTTPEGMPEEELGFEGTVSELAEAFKSSHYPPREFFARVFMTTAQRDNLKDIDLHSEGGIKTGAPVEMLNSPITLLPADDEADQDLVPELLGQVLRKKPIPPPTLPPRPPKSKPMLTISKVTEIQPVKAKDKAKKEKVPSLPPKTTSATTVKTLATLAELIPPRKRDQLELRAEMLAQPNEYDKVPDVERPPQPSAAVSLRQASSQPYLPTVRQEKEKRYQERLAKKKADRLVMKSLRAQLREYKKGGPVNLNDPFTYDDEQYSQWEEMEDTKRAQLDEEEHRAYIKAEAEEEAREEAMRKYELQEYEQGDEFEDSDTESDEDLAVAPGFDKSGLDADEVIAGSRYID